MVIGGGVAGLVAARDLAERGLRVVLTEAKDHFGGSVGAHRVGGMILDSGAESFATRNSSVSDLIEELGLSEAAVSPRRAGSWLHLPSGPLPMPSSGILGIPANPRDPELAGALTPAGRRRAALDRIIPSSTGFNTRSLGALVRARMGRQVLENLVAPVTMGIHSSHPDQLDVDVVAPGLRAGIRQFGSLGAAAAVLRARSPAGSQVGGLVGGMNQLSEALVADLSRRGVRLLSSSEVIAVDRDEADGRWMVIRRQTGGTGKRSVISGDVLVIATDGPTAVRLLGSRVPAERLPQVRPGQEIALATLVLDEPRLNDAPRGTGVLISEKVREVRAKALTHANVKWDWIAERAGSDRHVLRLSYGRDSAAGEQGVAELSLPDEQLIALALHDAARIMGVPLGRGQLVDADVVRWRAAMPRIPEGHEDKVRTFRSSLAGEDRLAVVGAWVSGTGLASLIPDARRVVAGLDLEAKEPPAPPAEPASPAAEEAPEQPAGKAERPPAEPSPPAGPGTPGGS
ncbi:protoporphyrinogen oxidase [Rothia sp. AR01]|uniref:Coproporphyrinogen III oxidase n=1 Tax=Rothia santali TaxID=2949643 RepID=A0A9X2HKR8_9MICC|nr:protoporphyrinogen oxidase [Rothia santali]MCP3426073.1 protoporphyrinogen oxidase [Rothia santali]